MSKRALLILIIIILLVIGVSFTSLETSNMQDNMNSFEDQLTSNSGVTSSINNNSTLSLIALQIQSVIDTVIEVILSFFKKLISIFN